jgi:hypothetical protein
MQSRHVCISSWQVWEMKYIRATAKLKDGLVYVQDLGTETNDRKGIFGQHRYELWNTDKKNESCGMSI